MASKPANQSDLTDSDKLFLISVVETYLRKVEAFDAWEKVMPAQQTVDSPWGERWFKEYDEGVLEGIHTSLRLQLTYKFGELPSDFVKQLCAIKDDELLSTIMIQVLTAQSLDEITLTPPQCDSGCVIREVLYIPLPYVTPNSKRMREVTFYASRIR